MEKTPRGTSVGVDDPYATVERCDHLTDDGRCRYAAEHGHHDPEFARERHEDDLRCPAADPDGEWDWRDCPHFRARQRSKECVRCGLEERRVAHENERPLLEEHHLKYPDSEAYHASDASSAERSSAGRSSGRSPREDGERGATDGSASEGGTGSGATRESSDPRADDRKEMAHEVTVYICRWCHAKVHSSWARLDDDAAPDPEAIAEAEGRRSKEHEEFGFETAAERFGDEEK